MNLETIHSTRKQLIDAVALLQRNRVVLTPDAVMRIKDNIWLIAGDIAKKYPYISSRLQILRNELFFVNIIDCNSDPARITLSSFVRLSSS